MKTLKLNFIFCTIFIIFTTKKEDYMTAIQALCHRLVISIGEAVHDKGCTRQTIYNNKDQFDWDGNRIIRNDKYLNWQPLEKGRPKHDNSGIS